MQLARLIGPDLRALLEESPAEVRELLDEIHPEDICDIVSELDDEHAASLLTELPTAYAAQVFERLDEGRREALTRRVGLDTAARLAVEMDADDRADFFEALPQTLSAHVLERVERLDPEAHEEVVELRRWPEDSAGGLMTTEYVRVGPDVPLSRVIEVVRGQARDVQNVDPLFVLDEHDHLFGILPVRTLLLAAPQDLVSDAMQRHVISVPPELGQEEAARTLAKYDLTMLPVVSERGELLGVITPDDVLDVLREEQTEDVQRLGAVEPMHEGYFDVSVGTLLRKRAPWLLALFVGGLLTTTAMQHYNALLAQMTQLAFYVPMLVSTGGNSGSQSSTLIIRGLAVGDVRGRDWLNVLGRELLQGLALGLMLAALGFARVFVSGEGVAFGTLVAATILLIVVSGCVVGAMMPLALNRVGLDPATSSTPFISTLVDVLGVLIYLGLAHLALDSLFLDAPVLGAG